MMFGKLHLGPLLVMNNSQLILIFSFRISLYSISFLYQTFVYILIIIYKLNTFFFFLEYGGRWKILHYYAIEFFSPIIVTSHLSQANELLIYIVSDKLYPISNCTLKLSTYSWNSMLPLHVHSIDNIKVVSINHFSI